MNLKFETNLQELKYKVLKAAACMGFSDLRKFDRDSIANKIITGPKPSFRCCIYKERQIIKDRLTYALDESKNEHIIQVIDTACDQCPIDRYTVTNSCRGCIARSCENACPVDAIYIVAGRAYINQEKCIECGRCKDACQFNAISDVQRPCRRSCPVDAIDMDEHKIATINYDKCISCGQCAYNCPFGAITDRSFIYPVANKLSKQEQPMYALIAPSIASQFDNGSIGQIAHALKKAGFTDVIEVALGADMVIKEETNEFIERKEDLDFMTTSCCPAFVNLVETQFSELLPNMSTTVSPMIALGRLVKNMHKDAVNVFIGPCMAKKEEAQRGNLKDAIDYVLTFEELRSLLDARDINVNDMPTSPLNNASYYGRMFAVNGGVSSSIKSYIEDNNLDIDFKPVAANGTAECIKNLKLAKFKRLNGNFMEGMVCSGGCISGPGSTTHRRKDAATIKNHASEAKEKTTDEALSVIRTNELHLHR
jgi:[FeFe] hydrogenase (group B1/B3)